MLDVQILYVTLPAKCMQWIDHILLFDLSIWLEIYNIIKSSKIIRVRDTPVIGRDGNVWDVPKLVDPGQKTMIQWHQPDRITIHYYICRIFL